MPHGFLQRVGERQGKSLPDGGGGGGGEGGEVGVGGSNTKLTGEFLARGD